MSEIIMIYTKKVLDYCGQMNRSIDVKSRLMTKTNKMACAPSEDSDQPEHPPSLIRVFTVRMKKG